MARRPWAGAYPDKRRTYGEHTSRIFPGSSAHLRVSFCRYLPNARFATRLKGSDIGRIFGAGDGIRTHDPNLGNETFEASLRYPFARHGTITHSATLTFCGSPSHLR